MRYTIKHTIDTDVDSFWNKLYFDHEFNESLYRGFFGYLAFEVLEQQKEDSGRIVRRVAATPNADLPSAAKAILRTKSLSFHEVGAFEPTSRTYTAQVAVDGTKKLSVDYEITVEPTSEKSCERIAIVQDNVKVPGLGAVIEAALQKATRDSYQRSADFANRWIREKGL